MWKCRTYLLSHWGSNWNQFSSPYSVHFAAHVKMAKIQLLSRSTWLADNCSCTDILIVYLNQKVRGAAIEAFPNFHCSLYSLQSHVIHLLTATIRHLYKIPPWNNDHKFDFSIICRWCNCRFYSLGVHFCLVFQKPSVFVLNILYTISSIQQLLRSWSLR